MNSDKRRVLTILVDRANYGRLKPVMRSVQNHDELELLTVVAGTMVLRRFDRSMQVVIDDGFRVDGEVYLELEGAIPVTMAKSVGFAVIEFASEIRRLNPDILLLIGDRYEALAAAIAAAYMNIPIVHVQGGEISGSIDESCRHAISKFSQFHCPATARSADYLVRMGERRDTILSIGCPSSDIADQLDTTLDPSIVNEQGSGRNIDVDKPFALMVFHPTTTQHGSEREQAMMLLSALHRSNIPTLLLWPNIDAGSDEIAKAIRVFRTQVDADWLHTITNLRPEDYLRVLANAAICIGNSSSFVRDAGYFGTPVVLVGNRQDAREADEHVTRVPLDEERIYAAIKQQLENDRYPPSSLYGDGKVADRIANAIANLEPYVQKTLDYPNRIDD